MAAPAVQLPLGAPPTRPGELICGRAAELEAVERFLDDIAGGPTALTVEGDTGSGKTTLWRWTLAAARGRGYRVLASQPIESESSLAFTGLGDLVGDVLAEVGPRIPPPQYRALRIATVIEEAGADPPDQRAISIATLSVLRTLAAEFPVLIAIDDRQWLDAPSAQALEFALRRIDAEPVGIVVALRTGEQSMVRPLLGNGVARRASYQVTLGPLPPDAIDSLLRARLGERFARSTVNQIATAAGGNPLFAVEIAEAVLRGEIAANGADRLSVPATLQQFVGDRLADLPIAVRDVLFLAAAAADPTIEQLERIEPPEQVRRAIDVAERSAVIQTAGGTITFSHPLFASTLYHSVPPDRRRALHRSLAAQSSDPDQQARHLALAAEGPDSRVAAVLDEAARRTASRGAPAMAADLAEQARRLTPAHEGDPRDDRSVDAAEYHFAAGDTTRARVLLDEVVSRLEPGPKRAGVLRRLAKVRYRHDSTAVAAELLSRALAEAGADMRLKAGIERDLAWAVAQCGDVPDAAKHAHAALDLIGADPADEMYAELRAAAALADFALGRGINRTAISSAVELERPRSEVPIEWRPRMALAMMLKWSGDLAGAGDHLEALHRAVLNAGDESSLPFLLAQMSEVATRKGELLEARTHAREAHVIAVQMDQQPMAANALYARALAEAHLGDHDDARTSAMDGLELSQQVGSVMYMMLNQAVLGFVELSRDDPAAAHSWLGPLVAWQDVVGIREPGILSFVPDEVEALISLGELDKADALLRSYEADAGRLDRDAAMLAAARVRALHTSAIGDSLGAAQSLQKALARHAVAAPPFEHARALLALGSISRRTRQRRAARTALSEALVAFERLHARGWAAKAHQLLGRSTSNGADPLNTLLTPAERRVAELVAHGATNREAADRLFVTVRAIEVHLTSVYRKLGISSRTQLALRMATDNGHAGGHTDG